MKAKQLLDWYADWIGDSIDEMDNFNSVVGEVCSPWHRRISDIWSVIELPDGQVWLSCDTIAPPTLYPCLWVVIAPRPERRHNGWSDWTLLFTADGSIYHHADREECLDHLRDFQQHRHLDGEDVKKGRRMVS